MKTKLIVIIALVVAAAAITVLTVGRPSAPVRPVQAWQLLSKGTYRAMGVTDPFLSWTPDSRSVVFSVFALKSQRNRLFRWKVGENDLEMVVGGTSPNCVTDDEFLYLCSSPKTIFKRSLSTGRDVEVGAALKKLDTWPRVTAFAYMPERRSVALRTLEFTQFPMLGVEEYDLSGKYLGRVESRTSEGIVDQSFSPDGSESAIMVQNQPNEPISLRLVKGDALAGKELANGPHIGAVAWSPDGRSIAYGDGKTVVLLDSEGNKKAIVGVFGDPDDRTDRRAVTRLSWSPNSQYLAAFVYACDKEGDYPLYYVLDMSKVK